ncbi:endonuclease/exonuclease/phosphatase family protein [Plantactinospora sp. GCM10030261]|uniref:endonuclease/exonuclease/phosphatase family protein n=1 Tax=Plantactinospora sp. GCM10030261 TaxID=3273420 RepID=UPI00360A1B3A
MTTVADTALTVREPSRATGASPVARWPSEGAGVTDVARWIRDRTTRLVAVVVVATMASVGPPPLPAQATAPGTVRVLTRNLYFGGDLGPSVAAPDLATFLAANAALLNHVDLVDFPARARLFAAEIGEHRPDLVGLQEVALWRTGPIGDPAPATTVRYDYLALLLAELAGAGLRYDVAVALDEADLEAPAGAPHNLDARLTLRDVILVRRGGRLRVTGTSAAHFTRNLVATIRATGDTVTFTRGWTAVDATREGRPIRFVNTHLEAVDPAVRTRQAAELSRGPLRRRSSTVLVGDLNSGPDLPSPADRAAYLTLLAGGMRDTWPLLHPRDPGFTADLGEDLDQPATSLEHRLDMIMIRGAVVPVWSRRFGTERQTPDGRWASDHLGHVAALVVFGRHR